MTEEEAKTKWCPLDRTDGAPCVGANCMMWRWLPLLADDAFKAAVVKAAADIGDKSENKHKAAQHVIANRAEYGLPTKPFDGFCGLAGKPLV